MARVVVDVMLKPGIRDPQGEAIASACRRLGFGQVTGVRQGKRFEVELAGPGDAAALAKVADLAAELLASPVIEEFTVRADGSGLPGRVTGNAQIVNRRGREPAGTRERMRIWAGQSGDPTATVRFCLGFPCEALSIPVMRRVLADIFSRLGVSQDCVADLLLAVTEACTNVLRHAGTSHRYEVIVGVDRTGCQLEVTDSGRGFDPGRLAEATAAVRRPPGRPPRRAPGRSPGRLRRAARSRPSVLTGPIPLLGRIGRARGGTQDRAIAALPESGRGLAIMRSCVDDVRLRSGPGRGTVVSMRKRIDFRPGAPLTRPPACELRDAG